MNCESVRVIDMDHNNAGAVTKAIKSRPDLHFGVYFSQFEWYHLLYLQDKNNSHKHNIMSRYYNEYPFSTWI